MSTPSDVSDEVWGKKSFENVSFHSVSTSTMENETNVNISTFSRGKKILIFTVIVIVVLIIVAMIVVSVSFMKSNTTSNQSNGSAYLLNDQTQPTTIPPAQIYEVGSGGTSDGSPCSSYTVINDPSRNVNRPGNGGACDSGPFFNTTIGGRWIRFMGTGGTVLPSSSPGMNHCNAFLALWSNATLPIATNTIVNGFVCIDTMFDTCEALIDIKIAKCTDFYVYFLPPALMCNARYCTT